VVNAPERVKISKKTTQTPSIVKRGGLLPSKRTMLLVSIQGKKK
jgi:hypothetical protein